MKAIEDMTNTERRKAYKRLWYQKKKYTKYGKLGIADRYEHIMDELRIYKKYSKAWRKHVRDTCQKDRRKACNKYYKRHADLCKYKFRARYHKNIAYYRKLDRIGAHRYYLNHIDKFRKQSHNVHNAKKARAIK